MQRYDVRTPSIHVPGRHLSGGNQQKVIIARELTGDLKLLLVAQPTRGLDVGSIEFIHRRIVAMRDEGTAILLVRAELDEIFTLVRPHRRALPRRARRRVRPSRRDARRGRAPHGVRARRRRATAVVGAPHDTPQTARRDPLHRAVVRRYFDLQPMLVPICAILLAFAVGGIIILLVGENPITAYWALLRGMFGSWDRIAASLGRSTPFIGAALAVAFAFRAGLFNIGVEGQLLIGATAAAWVGTWALRRRPARPCSRSSIVLVAGVVRWRPLRRDPGRAQGAHRRARGDHDDHAQQHRAAVRALDGRDRRTR